MLVPRYDVLELKYGDGSPAVLRHVDGSGFVYYPSGRKAICISSHGCDAKGGPRRFGAVVHSDAPRAPVVAIFDEWGRGYADGQQGPTDSQVPKILVTEKAVVSIDGSGKATETPVGGRPTTKGSKGNTLPTLTLRVGPSMLLRYTAGRTALEFQANGVSHTVMLGELHGEEVSGMPPVEACSLAEATMRQLNEATRKLDGVKSKVLTLKVDPSQKDTKPTFTLNAKTATLKDTLDNLVTLKQHLSHPNLAPMDLEWETVPRLRQLLAAAHPQCPGQGKRSWTISRISGKCTEERLASVKPTVDPPKTVATVSLLKLPELVDECASRGTLLVVICLATYALEQSNYARLIAEKANAELAKRFGAGTSTTAPPVRLVSVELSEGGELAQRYGVREVPYCLMFQGGHVVYSQRLRGLRAAGHLSIRPRVLLVEPNPAQQLKLERALRRSGFSSDLAMDTSQAMRLASRQQPYGILMVSALLRPEQLRNAVAAVRRNEPAVIVFAFDSALPVAEEDIDSRKRFLDECSHVFPYAPSYTGLAAVIARFDLSTLSAAKNGRGHKEDFLDEILGVLDRHRSGSLSVSPVPQGAHSKGPA